MNVAYLNMSLLSFLIKIAKIIQQTETHIA